jgi:hypothetical protein
MFPLVSKLKSALPSKVDFRCANGMSVKSHSEAARRNVRSSLRSGHLSEIPHVSDVPLGDVREDCHVQRTSLLRL